MRPAWLLFTISVSVASMLYAVAAIPVVIEAVSDGWKPMIDLSTPRALFTFLFIVVPATALILLRRRGKERKERLVSVARYSAATSLIILLIVFLPLLILTLLPAREGGGSSIIELTIPEAKELNQPAQRNAGDRPPSEDPPAFETTPALAPRG